MQYRFVVRTDPGRARENNEDSAVFDENTALMVLADGMGGYNAGEIASGMATAFIKTELSRWLQETGSAAALREVRRAMEICVENANLSIFNAANSNAAYAGMGTTLVVGAFRADKLLVGHIGDSRCYRWREGQLQQITKDHSLIQEQIDAGLITEEQASQSNIKNLVTRAVGVDEMVLLEINEHQVQVGDWYLLCSDGLSDMVDDAAIARILAQGQDLSACAQALVDTANANGGRDNITVILSEVSDPPSKRGLLAKIFGKS
ncbi:MAG: Stp1/IreP family PP2C-type Ser/Thr phosphatase [Rhodoferax sp.]